MAIVITLIIGILPIIILGFIVYKKDILEKEPVSLLVKLFFLGILATIPSVFMETLFTKIVPTTTSTIFNTFILSFFGIALIEEGYKALFTYGMTFKNKNFNHIYDGIVYSVFTSLGFAALENILYVLVYGQSAAILRALTSVPGHAFYGVSMGYYMGIAKYYDKIGNKKKCRNNKIISILLPVLFHGIFDFLLLTEKVTMIIIFFIFVAFLYALAYFQIRKHSKVMTMLE